MKKPSRRALAWAIIPLLWLGLALLNSMQPANEILRNGEVRSIPWSQIFRDQLRHYFWWMIISPLVVIAARRMPFAPGHIARAFAQHIVASVVVALLFVVLRTSPLGLHSFDYNYPPNLANIRGLLPGAVGVYWLLLAALTAFDAYARSVEKQREAVQLKAELSNAQLAMLRMQLEPHFLFNTLNTIAALVETRPHDARRMITLVGDLLRESLEARPSAVLPLEEELDWIERYLEIQQVRFRDRLAVSMNIEPRALRAEVPALILQPLVENAIKHGLEPTAGTVNIEIRGEIVDTTLVLTVRDDGPGLKTDRPAERVGLRNTRERLATLYGSSQRASIRQREVGVDAVIELPFTESTNGRHL